MKKDIISISLVGVGGQGTLLASEILCRVALYSDKDVKKSEVHGMAQRGGSVVSQIRIGEKVHSPLIGVGETDILMATEKLEALRFAHLLAPQGIAMVNDQEIRPVTVSSGLATWPDGLDNQLKTTFKKLELLPALAIARELGNVRVMNVAMLGALSKHLDVTDEVWKKAICEMVPPKAQDLNVSAFLKGKESCCNVSL